jgi:type I restriction enzyme S subunit
MDVIEEISIKVPDINTQHRIASILSTYDSLIENNRRRIQLLEQSARLLYREWFIYLRFPGHEHVRIIDGVPEGWRKKKLKEVADVNAISLNNGFQEKIEYIDNSSVTTGQINETTLYEFNDAPGRARRLVRHGDIIWSCVRPNRESHAIIWNPRKNLIASTGFAVISPIEAPTSYIYQALTTKEFVGYLTNNARGVAYPAVTGKDFESADILIPTNSLLEQFDGTVKATIEQINVLKMQNNKLKEARDILLPRLMNGEITV